MLSLKLSEDQQLSFLKSLYVRGNALLAQGKSKWARKFYLRGIFLSRQGINSKKEIIADIFHNLGMIAQENQEFGKAAKYYLLAIREDNQHSMTWLFLAKLYLERYQKEHNLHDYYLGMDALSNMEMMNPGFPGVKFLKYQYDLYKMN